jgi:hypothetical protein
MSDHKAAVERGRAGRIRVQCTCIQVAGFVTAVRTRYYRPGRKPERRALPPPPIRAIHVCLKVHKIENFFGFDFEICTFS